MPNDYDPGGGIGPSEDAAGAGPSSMPMDAAVAEPMEVDGAEAVVEEPVVPAANNYRVESVPDIQVQCTCLMLVYWILEFRF